MRKAGQVSHRSDEGDGCDDIQASQRHQCFDHRIHAPLSTLLAQCFGERCDALVGISSRLAVLIEGNLLGGMGKADRRQIQLERLRPRGLADVVKAVV
jgi:hypothetical protein